MIVSVFWQLLVDNIRRLQSQMWNRLAAMLMQLERVWVPTDLWYSLLRSSIKSSPTNCTRWSVRMVSTFRCQIHLCSSLYGSRKSICAYWKGKCGIFSNESGKAGRVEIYRNRVTCDTTDKYGKRSIVRRKKPNGKSISFSYVPCNASPYESFAVHLS